VTVNLPATVAYIYDLNGNLKSDGTRGFDYDDENQLIRVTVTNSWKSEFTYDGRFRRRIRKESTWQNSAWVQITEARYIYDGMLVIQERDVNNLPAVTYTRGRDLSGSLQGAGGIGGLLARTDGANSQSACYHADGNGNITAMVNAQQIVVARYTYDPFGNILSKSGPLADANTYRFSSQEYHQNSGLLLYLRRAYDPNLQRWLNRDPIGEEGGINLYNYVVNDPNRFVDLLGLDYYVLYVSAFSGFPHQVVIGDNGSGGSYAIEYGPANGGLNRIYGPGKYDNTPFSFPPKGAAYDLSKARCTKTSSAVDKALNDLAAGLGANNNPPNYCFIGNNCWSTSSIFDTTANNYQNFGTPYLPINTRVNLPPLVIRR